MEQKSKQQARELISKLVEKYENVVASGLVKTYNEEQTKKDFIQPLFSALGWETEDKSEVSVEEKISSDRVDYGFYVNGRIAFYLEAKKFSADLRDEKFAWQSVKYSFNKGATWAVLTDFENIILFNAQNIESSLADKKVFDIPFSKFLERFDELWLLSKESFRENKLDEYAERIGKKYQKISVSAQLSKDLNECREILTKELGAMNGISDGELLDQGVQKLLDRLVFIRVAEDRGLEPSTLIPLLREWEASKNKNEVPLFQSMVKKFRELDESYNSSIFKYHPFEQWEDWNGDATKEVIKILYGKEGYYEYDFNIIPADILGAVYENYLEHRLVKSKKQLTVEKDSRKRKEQGIYYTPEYIVDYIVKNTLGPALKNCKHLGDISKIRVCDPACGSGSFLIKALDCLSKKYEELGSRGENKFMALHSNIYGVDLDTKAVEIARLNLLINSLEKKEKLPDLSDKIKNGNSLISGTDEELKKYFGKDFKNKKPFNWEKEFPEVFENWGFDVIIGNPPYIKEFVNKSAFDGLHSSPYYQGKMDIWTMFGCVAIDLLKDGGMLGFIAPNNWVTNAGASIFRNKILKDGELKTFIDFGDYKVFEGAGIQTMIFVFEKKKPRDKYFVDYLRIENKDVSEDKIVAGLLGNKIKIEIEPEKLIGKNITFSTPESGSIFDKIQSKKNFELTEKEVGQGIVPAPDKYFIEKDVSNYSTKEKEYLKKYYTSSYKYRSGLSDGYLFYLSANNFNAQEIDNFPNIKNHFEPFKKELQEARTKYGTPDKPFFFLHRERDEKFFVKGPKIVCGVRTKAPGFFYTENEYYGSRALNFIKTERINLKYLTGIFNSKISYFWLKNKGKQIGDLLQVDKGPLMEIPICLGDENQQKTVATLVDKMLSLNKELGQEKEGLDKWEELKKEIERTDKEIDQKVYELYGLTDEEIKIVEG